MTTNPRGKCFISYKRTHIDETALLVDALRDRGIATWRDVDDLAPEPTEHELRATLADQSISSAVILVTPDVADSAMIGLTEAPEIFRRARQKDGFFLQPVLVGVDYGDVDHILRHPDDFQQLANWNLAKAPSQPLSQSDAETVACRVLHSRLSALKPTDHYKVGIYSRRSPGGYDSDLRHDFSPYFDGRTPSSNTFQKIEKALIDTATTMLTMRQAPLVIAEGIASLPLGVLYGAVFSPLAGFDLRWNQNFAGHGQAEWSLRAPTDGYAAHVDSTLGSLESTDVVLTIGVNADLRVAVAEYIRQEKLSPRVVVQMTPTNGPLKQGESLSPVQATAIALQAIDAVRANMSQLRLSSINLHVFLACPLGLAVLVGQKLNTIGNVVLYEHHAGSTPQYQRVHSFNPSAFAFNAPLLKFSPVSQPAA